MLSVENKYKYNKVPSLEEQTVYGKTAMRNCPKIQNTNDLCKDIDCTFTVCARHVLWPGDVAAKGIVKLSCPQEKEAINLRDGAISVTRALNISYENDIMIDGIQH